MLTALAGNDEIKIAIVKEGGIELVLSGMTQHQVSFFVSSVATVWKKLQLKT